MLIANLSLSPACGPRTEPQAPSGASQSTVADPLPSWNEGFAKSSIVEFVTMVSREGGPAFIPPADRIAVFDNDGTLWSEQPVYFQFAFAIDRVRALAPQHPEWSGRQPFAGILAGDLKAALAGGEQAVGELMAATHAGMTSEEFAGIVNQWLTTARHPTTKRPYTEMVYQPMLEMLAYLRANGFKTFIVSGGGIDFMRVWAEKAYGIQPDQMVGSTGQLQYELRDDKPVLRRLAEIDFVNDGPGKPVGIQRFIGKRPILAFGNSDGDLQMLQWTTLAPGPRMGVLVHHTDAEREWAYDRVSHIGKLDKALDEAPKRAWIVIDMRQDWKSIHPAPAGTPEPGGKP